MSIASYRISPSPVKSGSPNRSMTLASDPPRRPSSGVSTAAGVPRSRVPASGVAVCCARVAGANPMTPMRTPSAKSRPKTDLVCVFRPVLIAAGILASTGRSIVGICFGPRRQNRMETSCSENAHAGATCDRYESRAGGASRMLFCVIASSGVRTGRNIGRPCTGKTDEDGFPGRPARSAAVAGPCFEANSQLIATGQVCRAWQ